MLSAKVPARRRLTPNHPLPGQRLPSVSMTDAPPPESQTMRVEPKEVVAGQSCEISFGSDVRRGGYFFLCFWNGESWEAPAYVLQSRGRQPAIQRVGELPFVIHQYALADSLPDPVRLPDDLEPGWWRLCSTDPRHDWGAQIIVRGPGRLTTA